MTRSTSWPLGDVASRLRLYQARILKKDASETKHGIRGAGRVSILDPAVKGRV